MPVKLILVVLLEWSECGSLLVCLFVRAAAKKLARFAVSTPGCVAWWKRVTQQWRPQHIQPKLVKVVRCRAEHLARASTTGAWNRMFLSETATGNRCRWARPGLWWIAGPSAEQLGSGREFELCPERLLRYLHTAGAWLIPQRSRNEWDNSQFQLTVHKTPRKSQGIPTVSSSCVAIIMVAQVKVVGVFGVKTSFDK